MKRFEIATSSGTIPIELDDGSICLWDEEGETYCDGWATVEDIADFLVKVVRLSPNEARSVAEEAVRQWVEWFEGRRRWWRIPRRRRYPQESN